MKEKYMWYMIYIYIALTFGAIFGIKVLGSSAIGLIVLEIMSIRPFIVNIYEPLCKSGYYQKMYKDEKEHVKLLDEELYSLRREYFSLYNKTRIKNTNNQSSSLYNGNQKEIVDAVKYAMTKSHPDNGGSSEDFIKFKKLYDQIK